MIRLVCISALVLVTACASSNEADFLCGAQTGQPCASMSEVDGTSASGGRSIQEAEADTQAKSLSQPPLTAGKGGASPGPAGGAPYASAQYRIPEVTGRLWVAPYLDDGEILHEGTYVHFVVREARWGTRR